MRSVVRSLRVAVLALLLPALSAAPGCGSSDEVREPGWDDLYTAYVGVHASPDTSIEDLVARLAAQSPLPVEVDASLLQAGAGSVGLARNQDRLPLTTALDFVAACLRKRGAADASWCVENGRVLFSPGLDCPEKATVRIYTIATLQSGMDPHPDAVFISPDDVREVDDAQEPSRVEELRSLILERIEPDFWRTHPRAAIRCSGEHALVVCATEAVHERVGEFLEEVREETPETGD